MKKILGSATLLFLILIAIGASKKENSGKTSESTANTSPTETSPVNQTGPAHEAPKDTVSLNNEWENEELITIEGYSDHVMEIGISADGKYLLFNDNNDPNKDMHWSIRIDDRTYKYMGKVENTISPTVDGTPSFDNEGNLYFTTLKSYGDGYKTIYKSGFKDGVAIKPEAVDGNIYVQKNSGKILWISLDPDISNDGKYLFYSEGMFTLGTDFPNPFNVRGAERVGNTFVKMDDNIFTNVNTSNLEYAPTISTNGLELYFSRIDISGSKPKFLGIYVATRSSVNVPFGVPARIEAISGKVEAPVLSANEKTLYYHKLDGRVFKAYRVTRK